MNYNEFYNYIVANFTLDGASCRLIRSMLDYVAAQGFPDGDTNYRHLCFLLDGTIGLSDREIKMCQF